MNFRRMTVADAALIRGFHFGAGELSCETAFVNLLVWQGVYQNLFAVCGDHLLIKSVTPDEGTVYRLPFGEDLDGGIRLICEDAGTERPVFWVQEGPRLAAFLARYGGEYELIENRDAFDYLYDRAALASLSGKKYHSKRNHIAAFSRSCDWRYERITPTNLAAVRACAARWYAENADRKDVYMQTECAGVELMLSNLEPLGVIGGAVFVGEEAVAFTLGTAINDEVFDVHIEKALSGFATAYTVINREFVAQELSAYRYVNREDDMGLEGLRKAKLSYHPAILLKKYICRPR